MKEPKIFLVGGGGVPNYGDELIIQQWLRWYIHDSRISGTRVTVSGSSDTVLTKLFGHLYPGVQFSRSVRKARMQQGLGFYESVTRGYEYLSDPANAGSELHRELDGVTVFHLHGGGYLNAKWPTHGFMLGLALWAKENVGARVVGTGLGLGPLPAPEIKDDLARRVFRAFDILEIRDQWSFDYIQNHDLHGAPVLGYDDSFVHSLPAERRLGSTLHLSLRDDEMGGLISRWVPTKFVESFDHHVFWSCTPQDAGAYLELSKRFPYFELLSAPVLLDRVPVSEHDFMITQRFHPHLVGARLGMRGIYKSGSDYYDTKHGSVVDLGSPFSQKKMSDLEGAFTPESVTSELAIRSVEYVSTKRQLAARILT